jgi:hypothetical protein
VYSVTKERFEMKLTIPENALYAVSLVCTDYLKGNPIFSGMWVIKRSDGVWLVGTDGDILVARHLADHSVTAFIESDRPCLYIGGSVVNKLAYTNKLDKLIELSVDDNGIVSIDEAVGNVDDTFKGVGVVNSIINLMHEQLDNVSPLKKVVQSGHGIATMYQTIALKAIAVSTTNTPKKDLNNFAASHALSLDRLVMSGVSVDGLSTALGKAFGVYKDAHLIILIAPRRQATDEKWKIKGTI